MSCLPDACCRERAVVPKSSVECAYFMLYCMKGQPEGNNDLSDWNYWNIFHHNRPCIFILVWGNIIYCVVYVHGSVESH